MEGPKSPAAFHVPFTKQPTSPPATPGSNARSQYSSAANHASPFGKRMGGIFMFAQSPPLEHIEPIGKGPQFHYRPIPRDFSSRPSSASGRACASRGSVPAGSESDSNSESEDLEPQPTPPRRTIEESNLQVEEVADNDSDVENAYAQSFQPDHIEEATSEKGTDDTHDKDDGIVDDFQKLRCRKDSDSEDERLRRYRAKKKRWSAGLFKRSHSQSVGSDSDDDDAEGLDAHDVGSSARRLRRRIRGPSDRSSLIFEDIPNSNILEVDEEPDDGSHTKGPPSLPSDAEEFTLDALPFWVLEDPMDLDSGSSGASSAA